MCRLRVGDTSTQTNCLTERYSSLVVGKNTGGVSGCVRGLTTSLLCARTQRYTSSPTGRSYVSLYLLSSPSLVTCLGRIIRSLPQKSVYTVLSPKVILTIFGVTVHSSSGLKKTRSFCEKVSGSLRCLCIFINFGRRVNHTILFLRFFISRMSIR